MYERFTSDQLYNNVCNTEYEFDAFVSRVGYRQDRSQGIWPFHPRACFKLGLNPYNYEILPNFEEVTEFNYEDKNYKRREQKESIKACFSTLRRETKNSKRNPNGFC